MTHILLLAFAVFLLGEVKEVVAEPALPFVPQVQGLDFPGALQIMRVSGICPQNRKTPGPILKKEKSYSTHPGEPGKRETTL